MQPGQSCTKRDVKIISVADLAIMIITLALFACRDTAWVLSTPSRAVEASGSVSGSRPIPLRARPHGIGWHGGPQAFTGPTLSMINKTIVGRCRGLSAVVSAGRRAR